MFVSQEQLALPEPPVSAHERALSGGNLHTDLPPAVPVSSLLEDPTPAPVAPAPTSAPAPPAAKPTGVDLLGDLLAPLAIEAAPGTMPPANGAALDLGLDHSGANGSAPADPLALALYDGPATTVQVGTKLRDCLQTVIVYLCFIDSAFTVHLWCFYHATHNCTFSCASNSLSEASKIGLRH